MTGTRLVLAVLFTVALSAGLVAQSAQELYQRGLVQEHANGDLEQAIALYAQAAQMAGRDRALAAKSLIRIGASQEKLGGEAEAASAYADVVRAYPEQRAEVAIAQDRLKALRQAMRAGGLKASGNQRQEVNPKRQPTSCGLGHRTQIMRSQH